MMTRYKTILLHVALPLTLLFASMSIPFSTRVTRPNQRPSEPPAVARGSSPFKNSQPASRISGARPLLQDSDFGKRSTNDALNQRDDEKGVRDSDMRDADRESLEAELSVDSPESPEPTRAVTSSAKRRATANNDRDRIEQDEREGNRQKQQQSGQTRGDGDKSRGKPKEERLTRARSFNGDLRNLRYRKPLRRELPEREGPEPNPTSFSRTNAAPGTNSPTAPNAVSSPTSSAPASATTMNFDGLDFANWGAGHPPDTNGDVGPTYYIQVVNTSIGIFRKSDGVRVAAFTFNTFMSQGNFGNLCDTNNFGDPVVLYDSFEDRWIITDFAFQLDGSNNVMNPPGAFQCIAASKTGDPVTGGWNFYSINTTGGLGDYPKFGIWPDGLYMSANMFNYSSGGAFQNPRVYAFNKAQMYAGAPTVQSVSFDAPATDFTLLPSNARLQTGTPPNGTPNYFVSTWQYTNALSVYKFHVDWNRLSASTFTGPDVPTAGTSWPNASVPNAPSLGGNSLDVLQIRAMTQSQYSNIGGAESLWATHTVRRGNTSGFAAPRWYQVNVTGGNVVANLPQAATWDPDGANVMHRFLPSLAIDRLGDMAIGYSTSSSTTKPAIKYAGRLSIDPINILSQTEQVLIQGNGTQTGNCGGTCARWGDYNSMTLDPDGCTFWFTSEYYDVDGLNNLTRIGSFSFSQCTPVGAGGTVSGAVTNSANSNPINGVTVALGSRTTATNVNGSYTFSNLPAGTYPSITASLPGYSSSTVNSVVVTDGGTTTQGFSLTVAAGNACSPDTSQSDFQTGVVTNVDLVTSPGDVILSHSSLDQKSTTLGTSGVGLTVTTYGGQTFTPAVSGPLTKVDINLFCSGCTGTTPTLTLSIRNTSAGLPTGSDLASATITGFSSGASAYYTATFASPPALTAGTQYAIVIRPSANPAPGTYALTRSGTSTAGADVYAGGSRVTGATSGTVWSIPLTGSISTDAGFRVYINSGYLASGNLVLGVKDANPAAGLVPRWLTLSWTATTPANTTVQFQVAASNSIYGPFNFVGPDGTNSTFFNTSGASLSQFNGFRYLEYKAFLSTTDLLATPTLSDVTVCYDSNTPTITVAAPLSSQQAAASINSQIASVGDPGQAANTLTVTATPLTGTGVTLSNISVDAAGIVTADVAASCTATNSTFTLTVINSGSASATDTLTVNVVAVTRPAITPDGPTTVCEGGSVSLTSSSSIGNQWYLNGNPIGGATNQTYTATASGDYTVTANGCTTNPSAVSTVTVNPIPATPTITPNGSTTFCNGGVTLTSSGLSGNQWYLEGNPIGGATNQTYSANVVGNYTVVVTTNGCTSAPSAPTSVTAPTSTVVTTTADTGAGSLRETILSSCPGSTITFDPALTAGGSASIELTTAELSINKDLTIIGPGASLLTIKRSSISGTPDFRIFEVVSGNSVSISGLTVENGVGTPACDSASDGGGIYNRGTLTLNNVVVTGNTAQIGAGINSFNGALTIINSTIRNNHADTGSGGGIESSGVLTIINSTINGNTALSGGGIELSGGSANITNSTLSGNSAFTDGGGFGNGGRPVTLTNVTVADNHCDADNNSSGAGGGIAASPGVTLLNTLVAGNHKGSGALVADDIASVIDSGSFNLIGNGGSGGLTNTNGNQVGVENAQLGALTNNGGSTSTHLLLPGSSAINAGNNSLLPSDTFDLNENHDLVEALPVDQRGSSFARISNSTVDIGAVEVNYSISATAGATQSTTINSGFPLALSATVTESGHNQNGIPVTFIPPTSGASGAFSATATVNTDNNGVATAPSFTANGLAGSFGVVASIAASLPTTTFALTNVKGNQSIAFGPLGNKTYGDPDFVISASATSGLGVAFTAAGNCTVTPISPATIHLNATGTCTITASQSDTNYNPAASVAQSFTITGSNQTITFGALANRNFGDPDFSITANATSGLPLSFSATGQCTITGTTVHLSGAGACTITASQSGDANYNPAAGVPQGFTIAKANQAITFNALQNRTFGDSDFNLSAAANSGLPVSFSAQGNCTITGPVVHLTGAGACTVTASQAGDANHNSATSVEQSFSIDKLNQNITFGALAHRNLGDGDFEVNATASSGLPVYFTANGQCTISGATVHVGGAGSCTITAKQDGDTNFEAASGMAQTFTIDSGITTLISMSRSNYNVEEATGFIAVTVNRTGDLSTRITVDYATRDTGASEVCSSPNSGLAAARCDFGFTAGTLTFAPSETQKSFTIPITQDNVTEGPETFTINLSNLTGSSVGFETPSSAAVTITDSEVSTPNANDDTDGFVRQQYRDFLNREADPAGLAFWKDNIDKCKDPARLPRGVTMLKCLEVMRVETSAAFFFSIEFQTTGNLVRSAYVAALDRPLTNNMPSFVEFERDTQAMQRGVIVGQSGWRENLNNNRDVLMRDFVMRPEFVGLYPTTDTPSQYVDKLYQHAGITPTSNERASTINEFSNAGSASDAGARSRALLALTQNTDFQSREINRSLVQVEYFGFLRRNPNDAPDGNFAGYDFWLNKLNAANGDYNVSELVKAFLSSIEYRQRFGP